MTSMRASCLLQWAGAMLNKCRVPACANAPTKGSVYCLTHDEMGMRLLMAALGSRRAEPIEPPARVFEGLMTKIKEGTK